MKTSAIKWKNYIASNLGEALILPLSTDLEKIFLEHTIKKQMKEILKKHCN